MGDDDRLVRIESTIEQIKDALVTLVRIDERQSAHYNWLESVAKEVAVIKAEQAALKEQMAAKSVTISSNERVVWLLICAGLAALGFGSGAK